jgi:hypothetical protein
MERVRIRRTRIRSVWAYLVVTRLAETQWVEATGLAGSAPAALLRAEVQPERAQLAVPQEAATSGFAGLASAAIRPAMARPSRALVRAASIRRRQRVPVLGPV